jgi:hypothetical protein
MDHILDSVRNAVQYSYLLKAAIDRDCCPDIISRHIDEYKLYVRAVEQVYPAWLELHYQRFKWALGAFAGEIVHNIGYMIYRIDKILSSMVMQACLPVGDLLYLKDSLEEIYASLLDVLTPDAVPNFYSALLEAK